MADSHEAYPRLDEPGPVGSARDDGAQGAKWRTISVAALSEPVRDALNRALRRGVILPAFPELSVKGITTRQGFVLEVTKGRRRIGVELALSEFEGSTRVQISVPTESKPTDKELDEVVSWVERAFARAKWGMR